MKARIAQTLPCARLAMRSAGSMMLGTVRIASHRSRRAGLRSVLLAMFERVGASRLTPVTGRHSPVSSVVRSGGSVSRWCFPARPRVCLLPVSACWTRAIQTDLLEARGSHALPENAVPGTGLRAGHRLHARRQSTVGRHGAFCTEPDLSLSMVVAECARPARSRGRVRWTLLAALGERVWWCALMT
jgi:hypothetical protein